MAGQSSTLLDGSVLELGRSTPVPLSGPRTSGAGVRSRSGAPPIDRGDRSDESEQGTVGEGRLHPHRGDHARRAARSSSTGLGVTRGMEVLDLGCGDGTTALPAARARRRRARRRHRPQPGRGRQPPGRGRGPRRTCAFQEGDASRPGRPRATTRSISSSASSARCSRRGRSTWPRRWCGSRDPAAASSWATGSRATRRSSRRSSRSARPTRRRRRRASSAR